MSHKEQHHITANCEGCEELNCFACIHAYSPTATPTEPHHANAGMTPLSQLKRDCQIIDNTAFDALDQCDVILNAIRASISITHSYPKKYTEDLQPLLKYLAEIRAI